MWFWQAVHRPKAITPGNLPGVMLVFSYFAPAVALACLYRLSM